MCSSISFLEWSPDPGLNWRPHPDQGCALPTELSGLAAVRSVRAAFGAGNGIRTRDIQLGRLTLYQLSYSRLLLLVPGWRGLDSNQRRRRAGRFTVCSLWPLGYPSMTRASFGSCLPSVSQHRRPTSSASWPAAGVEPATY